MRKPETFGEYITAALQQQGYSERQLSKRVGVANSTLVRIRNGSIPEPDLFISIIETLDLDVTIAAQLIDPYRRLYERIISTTTQKGDKNE
ncbi:MAG: helix-turn-helix domain-containing protein [Pseudonocardiaceae bacterium]